MEVDIPVLWIAPAHNDFDNHLIGLRFWDGYILNSDHWALGDDRFLHLLFLFFKLLVIPLIRFVETVYQDLNTLIPMLRFNDVS